MAQKVKLKTSTVVGKVPTSANLDVGEVGINTADKKIYSKHSDGTIIEFGSDIAKDISYGQSLANIHERRVIDSLGSVIPTEIGYELGVLRNKGGLTKATLVTKIGARKPGTLFSVIPFNSTGDFTVSGSAVDEINSAGVSTTVLANEPRFDFQGEYVEATDNSYYDFDASTGKVTIPSQTFADGESWSVIDNGAFDDDLAYGTFGVLVGGQSSKTLQINHAGKVSFRSSTSTYYDFTKTFASIQNVETEFTWVCNGTTISLYINGVLDSTITPDFTELYISKFIKGYSNDTRGCSGKNYRNEIWNRALSASEVLDRYNGVAIDPKYIGANNVEEVTNGTFDTDTDWIKYGLTTISIGLAHIDASGNALRQNDIINTDYEYLFEYTINSYTSGSIRIEGTSDTPHASNGTFRVISSCIYTFLNFYASASTVLDIDNVSITRLGNTLLLDGGKTDVGSEIITVAADREFSSDTGFWTKLIGTTISGGLANITANGSITSSSVNHVLRTTSDLFSAGKSYLVTFDARQVTGVGNFQVGNGYSANFNQAITGVMTTYSFYLTANWLYLVFGGSSVGATFEVDNISVVEAPKWYDKTHNIIADALAPLTNPNGFTTNVHPILTKPKLLLEPNAINLFQDSSNPVTQTIPTVIGTKYTCSIKDAGLLTLAETGGNGRGGIVTEVDEFTYIATATSMVVTVVTAPANVNFTATSFPLRHIPTLPLSTATKAVDAINLSGLQANGMLAPTEGSWFVDFGKGITNKATALLEFLQIGLLSGSVFADKISFTSDANNYIAFNYYGNTFTSAIDITNAKVLITWDNTEAILNINGVDVKTWTGITPKAIDYYRSVIQTDLKITINDTWCRNVKITSQADRNALTT